MKPIVLQRETEGWKEKRARKEEGPLEGLRENCTQRELQLDRGIRLAEQTWVSLLSYHAIRLSDSREEKAQ